MQNLQFRRAIDICRQGGVIAYPTESVFGLGCLALKEDAVMRVLRLKKRSVKKGLICVASKVEQLEKYVNINLLPDFGKVLDTWPGPVTWLIPSKKTTPFWLTGEHSTLAVRVSADNVVRNLCDSLGAIVSTSANLQGDIPAYDTKQVFDYFGNKVDYIIPAKLDSRRKPTEIRDAMTGELIR